MLAGAQPGDIAGMVAGMCFRFVGRLLLFVDDDQADIAQRGENGGPRSDDDPDFLAQDALPLHVTLGRGQPAVQDGDGRSETGANAPDHLGRQADLGHKDQNPSVQIDGSLSRLQVNFGLAAAGHAEQQVLGTAVRVAFAGGQGARDAPDGLSLVRVGLKRFLVFDIVFRFRFAPRLLAVELDPLALGQGRQHRTADMAGAHDFRDRRLAGLQQQFNHPLLTQSADFAVGQAAGRVGRVGQFRHAHPFFLDRADGRRDHAAQCVAIRTQIAAAHPSGQPDLIRQQDRTLGQQTLDRLDEKIGIRRAQADGHVSLAGAVAFAERHAHPAADKKAPLQLVRYAVGVFAVKGSVRLTEDDTAIKIHGHLPVRASRTRSAGLTQASRPGNRRRPGSR